MTIPHPSRCISSSRLSFSLSVGSGGVSRDGYFGVRLGDAVAAAVKEGKVTVIYSPVPTDQVTLERFNAT